MFRYVLNGIIMKLILNYIFNVYWDLKVIKMLILIYIIILEI